MYTDEVGRVYWVYSEYTTERERAGQVSELIITGRSPDICPRGHLPPLVIKVRVKGYGCGY